MRIQAKTEEQAQNHPQKDEHENGGAGPSRHRPYSQEEAWVDQGERSGQVYFHNGKTTNFCLMID